MAEGYRDSSTSGPAMAGSNRAEAIYRATQAISTELSLDSALQKIVDAARELVKARYGALGVVDEEARQLTRFIVSGVTQEEIRAIHHWPRGLGLLGELIRFPRPLRVKDIGKDPRSVGFPSNHPPMKSFLGVPIMLRSRVLGNFYMADKSGEQEFSQEDEEILSLFAANAAIALENARLYTETDIRLREKVVEVERAERRSRFLAELGARLLRLRPGEELGLGTIAEKMTEPLGDAVAIYLVDPDRPREVIASTLFHRVEARRAAAQRVIEASWDDLRDLVLARRRSALETSSDGESEPVFGAELLKEERFTAAMAVPIASRQTTYGLFVSLASHPVVLSEDDRRFALLIADRLGAALESAQLYRKESEARQKVQELADLAQHHAAELETVLNTMPEPVYVVAPDGLLIRTNDAYSRLAGSDPTRTQGEDRVGLLTLRDETGHPLTPSQLPWVRALTGESFTNQVFLFPGTAGYDERFLNISGAPIRGPEGNIVAGVNVARDITEMKELDRQKDEFISVASHELKSPLTVIKGYTQLLLQKLKTNPERAGDLNMANHILEQANRMTELADRLLDVSRIQFGQLQLDRQPTDLASLVRDTSERMQVSNPGHPIQLSAEGPVEALVDAQRIEQVLSNLLSNAARYSPEGAGIEVVLERQDGDALVSVRDHGPGIPKEHRPNLFKRFYRGAGRPGKGSGLGLYVSRGIVEAHGGKIWFDTREGEGSTFHVRLPLDDRA